MRMVPSNVRKKIRELPNVIKVQAYVMLALHNVRIVPLNMRKKKKGTTECDKNIVTCNVGPTQCEYGTIKCENK